MKTHARQLTAAWLVFIALCLLPACNGPRPSSPIDPQPTLTGQHNKDATVLGEADKIDAKVSGSPVAADVKASTDAQRAAVAAAPASDVDALVKRYEAIIATLREEIAKLRKQVEVLTAKLEDFANKLLIYVLLGLGALFAVSAVVAGYLKQPHAAIWLGIGSAGAFGAARVIGHWLFPFVVGAVIVTAVAGLTIHLLAQAKERRAKAARLAAGDEVIKGVEAARAVLKDPPVALIEAVVAATNTIEALAAIAKIKAAQDAELAEWVTASDGTQQVVDERRRALGLIS